MQPQSPPDLIDANGLSWTSSGGAEMLGYDPPLCVRPALISPLPVPRNSDGLIQLLLFGGEYSACTCRLPAPVPEEHSAIEPEPIAPLAVDTDGDQFSPIYCRSPGMWTPVERPETPAGISEGSGPASGGLRPGHNGRVRSLTTMSGSSQTT